MFGYFEQKVGEVWNVLAPLKTDEELFFTYVEQGQMGEVERCLMEKHLSPNLVNQAGNSLLHVACYHGREGIAKRLIDAGANPSTIGSRGNTCIHYAAQSGNQRLVDMMIAYGVSVAQRNAAGKNAYDLATGFSLKQHLMKLVLAEEQRTGTAPVLSGVTRDMSGEEERLRNLPPPPTFGTSAPAQGGQSGVPPAGDPMADPNYRPTNYVGNRIKEDGFVTTVGNPELSAKYGNTSSFRPAESDTAAAAAAPATQGVVAPPTFQNPNVANTPFARGRYVSYDVQTGAPGAALVAPASGSASSMYAPPAQSTSSAPPAFFNPGAQQAQGQQQQPGVQYGSTPTGQQPFAQQQAMGQPPQQQQQPAMATGQQFQQQQQQHQQQTGQQSQFNVPQNSVGLVSAVAPPPPNLNVAASGNVSSTNSPKRSPVSFTGVLPGKK